MFLVDATVDDAVVDQVGAGLVGVVAEAGVSTKLTGVGLESRNKSGS